MIHNINYEKILKKIENDKKCINTNCCFGIIGPTGATGPTGNNANSATCFCVEQMRNIIQQIITLYPNDNLIIAMESGNNASGYLEVFSLVPTTIQILVFSN